MEFDQFYTKLGTVLGKFPILKTMLNEDRFRPMVPSLVSSDMAFMFEKQKHINKRCLIY